MGVDQGHQPAERFGRRVVDVLMSQHRSRVEMQLPGCEPVPDDVGCPVDTVRTLRRFQGGHPTPVVVDRSTFRTTVSP